MADNVVEPEGVHEPHRPKTPRKAAISSWIGSALEYYDFFIYGAAAALIFPKIFFPAGNPAAATIASLATFGVAYVARPIGSFILGHLGDTIGRKRVLVITLFGMGSATFLIGVLPTYDQVGIAAPILLLVLRVLQGLAVSGEQSSASSTTLEHAPATKRAYFSSFTLAGTQFGNILATAIFIPVAALPNDALLSWGWRIPFLLSVVVMVVGWWIRRTLHESPAFEDEQEHQTVPKAPLKELFGHYTPEVLKIVFAALASVNSTIFGIYLLTYGVNTIGLPRTNLLTLQIVCNIIALGAIPAAGLLAVHLGCQPGEPAADLDHRHRDGGGLLQRLRRGGVRAVERTVRHQGAHVRRSGRHPVRVRPRRFRTSHRRSARRPEPGQLDPGGGIRQRGSGRVGDRGADHAGELQDPPVRPRQARPPRRRRALRAVTTTRMPA